MVSENVLRIASKKRLNTFSDTPEQSPSQLLNIAVQQTCLILKLSMSLPADTMCPELVSYRKDAVWTPIDYEKV